VERSRRSYFLLLALAGGLGWWFGLWAAPLVAFAVLEAAWTAAEWAHDRSYRGAPNLLKPPAG
jgi:hypothetical protein